MRISDWSSDVCSSDLGSADQIRTAPTLRITSNRRNAAMLQSIFLSFRGNRQCIRLHYIDDPNHRFVPPGTSIYSLNPTLNVEFLKWQFELLSTLHFKHIRFL